MLLPIPQYAPDLSDYDGETTQTLLNVLPLARGYAPFKAFNALSGALADGNDTYTKVLLHFDGTDASTTITDSNAGGSAHTWTAAGNAQIDTAQYKFGGASGLFDGTGDYVSASDHTDFTLGSGAWTIDLYFNCNVATGTVRRIAAQCDSSSTTASGSFFILRAATGEIIARAAVGSTLYSVTGTTQYSDSANTGWHHLAFVRTGDTLKLFLDGTQEGGDVSITGTVNNSSNAIAVGQFGEDTASTWLGWIDEFRISVGIARWTTTFTAPGKAYDAAANGVCRGFFCARNNDASVTVFAATSTRLFRLHNTDLNWVDVSKSGTAYTALTSTDNWQFAQFNNFVFATQGNSALQRYDLTSSTAFADAPGSPPQAKYIAVVGRFLMLSGLGSSTPYRVRWSDLNDTTNWTTGSSDFQDLPDGGLARTIGGGEFGYIFQDGAVRRMTYAPGSSVIFVIERIAEDRGIFAPLSVVKGGDRVFYIGTDGFKMIPPGGFPTPIGQNRVDQTFFDDVDTSNLQLCIGASDPKAGIAYWAYKSTAGASGLFDKIIAYNWNLDRWAMISMSGEYIGSLAQPGITLENLDSVSASLDALSGSLDDIAVASFPKIAAFNSDHKVGFFSGSNLEATMVTAERGGEGRRLRVKGFRPITDAATVYGSVSKKNTAQSVASYSSEVAMNSTGYVPHNVSTRYARGKIRIPAGTTWTRALGIEPDVALEGKR